jgi:hypothetical protein
MTVQKDETCNTFSQYKILSEDIVVTTADLFVCLSIHAYIGISHPKR